MVFASLLILVVHVAVEANVATAGDCFLVEIAATVAALLFITSAGVFRLTADFAAWY
jgi:hypothetical protein